MDLQPAEIFQMVCEQKDRPILANPNAAVGSAFYGRAEMFELRFKNFVLILADDGRLKKHRTVISSAFFNVNQHVSFTRIDGYEFTALNFSRNIHAKLMYKRNIGKRCSLRQYRIS